MTGVGAARVRVKVAALLVVLTVLWGYATFLTARDAADLLAVRALGEQLGQPTDALILGLQAERRLTMIELADPGRHRAALAEQRPRTDEAVDALRRFTRNTDFRLATAGVVRERAAQLVYRLDAIGPLREDVDGGRLDRPAAAAAYERIVDAGFAVYGSQWASRRTDLIEETRALVALARAGEMLAREDALVTGALAAARLTEAEHARLVDLVAVQRFARAEAAAGLPAADRASYDRLAAGPAFAGLRAAEDLLIERGRGSGSPPVRQQQWQAAVEPALSGLRGMVAGGVRDSVDRATPGAAGVIARTGLIGGLGLIVVVAAFVLSIRAGRHLTGQLDSLRVERAERAELTAARDELTAKVAAQTARLTAQTAQLTAQAAQFTAETAQRKAQTERAMERAARAAAQLAAHRRARDVFVKLTRDSQRLLHRQIGLLDAMERRETDTDELAELFRVDHLATLIRRNVEQLISLSGGIPGRRWRRPVPIVDVVRSAVAEVSDYPRVLVAASWSGAVAGRALPDLIHLLAELIENALSSSPATTTVRITGEARGGALVIVVTDDGPGRSPGALTAATELIRDTPATGPLDGTTGLYVIGRLARRHGITIELTAAARGGTAAVVSIPASLLVEAREVDPAVQPPGPAVEPAKQPAGSVGPTAPANGDRPPTLPVRARRPVTDASADLPESASGPQTNGVPVGRTEADCSATMELPVTRPEPIDGSTDNSERTTGDSRSGHDR